MLGCHVTPADEDNDIERNTTLNSTVATNSKTEATTESQVTNVPPHKDEEENGGKNMETSQNNTQTTNQVSYDVVSAETNHTADTNNSDSSTNSKHDLNTSEESINTVPPLLDDKVEASMGSENIEAVKSVDQVDNNNKHMPSGIIALVTAISFAVAIALVYIGMIVWRRYIEYRYGHRELLVNELEFDTNDLRHFEVSMLLITVERNIYNQFIVHITAVISGKQ
ncbi:hypothetical protein WN48_10885 [Eufriesea mexicana]|uniref:Uncharacterized protein n=1 Tax=Eufriesea mexicana TaxID=516756 RepID=A0A310SQ87_9HYME|nr:hypothetical protein WN48_10885 [Eufriesea mexicana]